MTIDDLIIDANRLAPISPAAASSYSGCIPEMKSYVDRVLADHEEIDALLGPNPIELLQDNHQNHADFMATVFGISNYELLARIVPWVYHAYTSRGVSADYFPVELNAWIVAMSRCLDNEAFTEILPVYSWMLRQHNAMVFLSAESAEVPSGKRGFLDEQAFRLVDALIDGDQHRCEAVVKGAIDQGHALDQVYVHVVQQAMTEIGRLWEINAITVNQEHLASAIIGKVLASLDTPLSGDPFAPGKAIVAAAPNEFHEIGAWMIYDILESEGWEVRYFGANTAVEKLTATMSSFEPDLVALSVTMPFNIIKATNMIRRIRDERRFNHVKIIVGGRAFHGSEDLWKETGADEFANDAHAFLDLLHTA